MKNRALSFVIIIAIYTAAVAAGAAVLILLPGTDPIPHMFVADMAATAVVFISSLIFKNASVYDPYWSVAPVFIVIGYYTHYGIQFYMHHLFVLLPFLFWSVRLTYNWARGFESMKWEDWRYRKYRAEHPKVFPVISFFGIMLMPTWFVYFSSAPVWAVINSSSLTVWHIIGGAVILFAALYQTIADRQMREFRRNNKGTGKCIDEGLWRHSRHPNYLGEILIWLGVGVSSFGYKPYPSLIFPLAGVFMMSLLFNFVSIPLMEKHILSNRPEYAEYKKRVPNALIPWFRKAAVTESQIEEETENA